MRGNLICSGEVHIRLKGKLSGSIEAKTVHIDKKCEAEFVRPIRAELVDIEGIISARNISTGKVVIQETGRLTGAVFGRDLRRKGRRILWGAFDRESGNDARRTAGSAGPPAGSERNVIRGAGFQTCARVIQKIYPRRRMSGLVDMSICRVLLTKRVFTGAASCRLQV